MGKVNEILSKPFGELQLASDSKGLAMTTTAQTVALPIDTDHVQLTTRNFTTAVVAKVALNPYILVLKTTDALATLGNSTEFDSQAQDGDGATHVDLSSLDTAANLDFLYVGAHLPIRGIDVDVDGVNSNGSVLTVKYRKNDDTWVDISATDGTTSGGATFAQDGLIDWTVPTDWKKDDLISIGDSTFTQGNHVESKVYWTRWEVSAALDGAVTLDGMRSLSRFTKLFEMIQDSIFAENIQRGFKGIGCVEGLVDSTTGFLIVNVGVSGERGQFPSS